MIKRLLTLTIAIPLLFVASMSAQNSTADRYAEHSLLANGKWVKIRVSKAGVYEISKSKLSSMGFSNPDKVALYGYNLPILPEAKIEEIKDDMTEIPVWRKSDGSILFYSCGVVKWQKKPNATDFSHINNPYSNYVYYFLTEKDTAPLAMEKKEYADSYIVTTNFIEHALEESDGFSFINTGRTFFEAYDFKNGNKKSYHLETPGISSPDTKFTVVFAAGSASSLTISIDDTTFIPVNFRNKVEYEYGILTSKTYNWKNNKLNAKPVVTLAHTREADVSGHLDYIQICYQRKLDLSGLSQLMFQPQNSIGQTFQISGANENTHVWQVTSPETTCEIASKYSSNTLTASVGASSILNNYVAVNVNATFPEPEIVGAIENQDLHMLKDIDYVIIVPANGVLTAQAQRLADAHTAKDSMRCVVVRADQIYNEFSSGTPDITAYRRFLKMLYDKAETPENRPKNVCLFGDGVWDNRMNILTKYSQDDYLLCYESVGSLSHTDSYVAEEYITLLADNKGVSPLKEQPDCGVGRITVGTERQARAVVNKLISYINNTYTGAWKNTICMMADDGNNNIHMQDADEVTSVLETNYPDYKVRKIYWDSYAQEQTGAGMSYTTAYKDINKQVDDGALIMNYTGHGAPYCLSHEQVLKKKDFAEWESPRLPLWIHAACDVTPFDMDEENIGEVALLNDVGGAMGVISTTRTVYSAQNRKLNVNLTKRLLEKKANGQKMTIGEALAQAKCDIIAASRTLAKRDSINKCHFVLLGDPAIALATPSYKVVLDEFNGKSVPMENIDTVGAGAMVTISGHIEDEDGKLIEDFNGTVSPTIMDNIELVKCMNNANEDVEPYQFYSRVRTIFTGNDSINDGRFTFTFPVPLDVNYSYQPGLISLYATNSDNTQEANGHFTDFAIGGTSPELAQDDQGPEITITINGIEFSNKTSDSFETDVVMHETPYFNGYLFDENGINTIGSGIGHDITLMIDNDPALTVNLNDYFQYAAGSWTKGAVSYIIPELSTGNHTLLFRAWDMLNNPSTLEVKFNVLEGLAPNILAMNIKGPVHDKLTILIENDRPQSVLNIDVMIYDISGREVWKGGETSASDSGTYNYTCNLNALNGHLQPGIYICKASVSTDNGAKATESKKFIVTAQ